MAFVEEKLSACERIASLQPWPGFVVDAELWECAGRELASGRLVLSGLWSEGSSVYLALLTQAQPSIVVLRLPLQEARFPSIARLHRPALRLERALHDLYGLLPDGLPILGPGLITGAGALLSRSAPQGQRRARRPTIRSCLRAVRCCIKSRWGPCMPA